MKKYIKHKKKIPKKVFDGIVEKGELFIRKRHTFDDYIDKMQNKEFKIIIKVV